MRENEAEGNKVEEQRGSATLGQRVLLFLVAALVILVDHFSKLYVENQLPLNQTWAPFPEIEQIFRITHVSNTGAAFGLFPDGSQIFTVIAILVGVVIVIYNYQLPPGNYLLRVALGLQLGGALGNLVDRVRIGHVTDFLDFGPWPVFNLADTAIVAGVLLLGFLMLQEQTEPENRASEQPSPRTEREDEMQQASLSKFQSSQQNEPTP